MIRTPQSVGLILSVLLCACPPEPAGPGDGGLHSDSGLLDAGTQDAGAQDGGFAFDAGTLDGGFAFDAGTFDGGPKSDGGTSDGGSISCETAFHDALLGTAHLGPAFQVVDSAPLPLSYHLPLGANVELVSPGTLGLVVYGMMSDGRVHRLGTWPNLALPAEENLTFDAVNPSDRALQVLTTWSLPATGAQLLASYRTVQARTFVGGAVARFDLARPDAGVTWLAAPGVESQLGLGTYFLVGADSLGTTQAGPGVYALDTSAPSQAPVRAAAYPAVPTDTVRPGLMAVTTDGVVVLGYALDLAARQSLRLPPTAALMEAFSGGATVVLAETPELTPADDVANLAGFGRGVALLHATAYQGILPALGQLDYVPLTPKAGGAEVGTPVPILMADDTCTVVSQLVPAGEALLVGLWDRNGQRLVRLAPR